MRTGALLLICGVLASVRGAEITVPGGVLRVEKNSQVRVTDGQVELTRGTITYQVEDAAAAQVEILTPSVSARASENGAYRIVIRKTGESEITAQSGRMVVMAPGGEQWLEAGQRMIARGPRGNPQFRIVSSLAWWKRLAGLLQNIQIGGGGGVSVESGGGEETTSAARASRTKPQGEKAAAPSGNAHASGDRPKTSDGHSNPPGGGSHSGDSRPVSNGGGAGSSHSSNSHSAPAPSTSHSSESHAAPATSSHSDNTAKGK